MIREHGLIDFNTFKLPQLTEQTYGFNHWEHNTPQIYRELYCFAEDLYRIKARPKRFPHKSALCHLLKVIMLLWPRNEAEGEGIALCTPYRGHPIFNSYFLNILKDLCIDGRSDNDIGLTGPASSAKTFAVSVFLLCAFYARPKKTSVLVSTTSGTASERRIWGDIKALHRRAKFLENNLAPIGRIVDYLKALTFMTEDELSKIIEMKKYSRESSAGGKQKDLRNGLIVIPIADDSTGDAALDTIMGTKNVHVYWAVDELPAMQNGVLRPRANLVGNLTLKIAGIGNAYRLTDPHGDYCKPKGGWGSVNVDVNKCIHWEAETCHVLCLNGLDSPNDYAERKYGKAEYKEDLPFGFLCNRFGNEYNENTFGLDSVEYWRFSKGLWIGEQSESTILSEGLILINGANQPPEAYRTGSITLAGFDPGFASGGDANSLIFIEVGQTTQNETQLTVDPDSISINPVVKTRDEYRKTVAKKVVAQCISRGVEPRNFFMDISGDGGLMMKEIMEEWGSTEIMGLSSMEPPSVKNRYSKRVAQYWFQCQIIVKSGIIKGFNTQSLYAADLFSRFYENTGKVIDVEKKRDMKKRIGRSPDHGDSYTYAMHGAVMRGYIKIKDARQLLQEQKLREADKTNRVDVYFINGPKTKPSEYAMDLSEY